MASKEPEPFNLKPRRTLAGKYVIVEMLGSGWEGEAYLVREKKTGLIRVAKFYYPERNVKGEALKAYARRLDQLSDLSCVIRYMHSDHIVHNGRELDFMVSSRAAGEQLSHYIERRGGALDPLEALLIFDRIAEGLEDVHAAGLYHGDVHEDNVMVVQRGIRFEIRFLDFINLGRTTRERKRDDVYDLMTLLRTMTGGVKKYRKQPALIKALVKGGRRDLIYREFPTARRVRKFIASKEAPDFR